MKGVIVYKGKYGATSQYAVWISDELQLPVFIPGSISTAELSVCDFVIAGGSVYMGKLLIGDWLKQHVSILQNKRIFLFVVCATPFSEEGKREKIIKDNIPVELANRCDVFFLPGRLDIKALSFKDRLAIKFAALMEKDPLKKQAMKRGVDEVKMEHLGDLLKAVNSFAGREDAFFATEHAYTS